MEDFKTQHNRMVIMQALGILKQLDCSSSLHISQKLNKAMGMLYEISNDYEIKWL